MSTPIDVVQSSFEQAMREFERTLSNKDAWTEILKTKTIDDVYDLTDQLQKDQAKTCTMRGLTKIEPFLKGLNEYADVIEVFIQAKPDVLALIWGPIKLLIHLASTLKQSFDAVLNITAEIGQMLPEFQTMSQLFGHNKQIQDILILFFKDILDFYAIALNFFNIPRWKFLFEILWPKYRDKMKLVMVHIERHTSLFRNQVRMEHIQEEHVARIRAFQHFEDSEKANIRQEFHAIKSDVSPKLYGYTMDQVRSRTFKGTEAWIKDNTVYKNWLDPANKASSVLWVQGIPGAGKTYLSSIIVDDTTSLGRVSYAFLSHNLKADTTVLHVLHTLIFELVSQDESLQEFVCKTSRKNLKSNTEAAVEVLKQLIMCADTTYIVVDGLDEIDYFERNRLLSCLLRLTRECEEARLVISSRAESDIAKMLQDKAVIRVDVENNASIQHFINQRTSEWLRVRNFEVEVTTQIQTLLLPLASKAEGMFLYANIVLQSIELLDDPDEIRRELDVLPQNLDDAYARIVRRINELKPVSLVQKAHKLLGMIVCSPIPLKIHKLEQLMRIEPYDIDDDAKVRASVDPVALCGPIVEVIDEYVQLVHFTVKEYLTSSHTSNPIDTRRSILILTECCITYLCHEHHRSDLHDDKIRDNVLQGYYRLHIYACTMWYSLLGLCVQAYQQKQLPDGLADLIEILALRRRNPTFDQRIETKLLPRLESAFSGRETITNFLKAVANYNDTCRVEDVSRGRADEWRSHDPTTLFETSSRIHSQINLMLCSAQKHRENCHCSELREQYDQYLHKCAILSCHFARRGFDSFRQCKMHEKTHEKAWTCSFSGCAYEKNGFLSRKMRDDHWELSHNTNNMEDNLDPSLVSQSDLIGFLYDLLDTGNVTALEMFKLQFKALPSTIRRDWSRYASELQRLECLLAVSDLSDGYTVACCAATAVLCQNDAVFEQLLSSVAEIKSYFYTKHFEYIVGALIRTETDKFWEIWNQWYFLKDAMGHKPRRRMQVHTYEDIIRATQNDPVKEDILVQQWTTFRLETYMRPVDFGEILYRIVSTTCSLRFASKVIELAGDTIVDVDKRISEKYPTALRAAARQSSAEAAEMVKFLLSRGANPDKECSRSYLAIREERGALEVQKWLGITWDELVAQTKAQPAKQIQTKTDSESDLDSLFEDTDREYN